ncbi:MAG: hypothetical protein KBT34_12640 [Prevotella sp.]|nr:hypothetical protein [Candidatus Prevotella equi]
MKHDYYYNFGYLSQWMTANPELSKRKVLQSLGSNDYECFNRWLNGEITMPTSILLKFCNIFGVPLSNFFRDKNADTNSWIVAPSINDMIEPQGGYPNYGHKMGRQTINPHSDLFIESNDPMMPIVDKSIMACDKCSEESETIQTLKLTMSHQKEILEERHKQEIANIQKEWAIKEMELRKQIEEENKEERKRLLNIISIQSNQIADLTRINENVTMKL